MLPNNERPFSADPPKQGVVEKLVSGGDGLIRLDGQVIFVPGVLPGEEVLFQCEKQEKGFRRGVLLEVLTPSSERRKPLCTLYGVCGGCDLMHLSYEAQLENKRSIVQESFRRIGKIEIDLPPIVSSPEWGYRSRVQWHKDAAGHFGFKARSAAHVVSVLECPVAHPAFRPLLQQDHLSLPVGRFNAFAKSDGYFIDGRDKLVTVELLGKRFHLSLDGFFQSNLDVLPKLLEDLIQFVSVQENSTETALDLFCGSGLFGAFLADHFHKVIAVEENRAALELAKKNIPGPLHEFHAASLETWIRKSFGRGPLHTSKKFVAAVVDPPRPGLSTEVRAFLKKHPPRDLFYVSCNPDTLARDAADLLKNGFRLDSLKLYDFYPQTAHIEALARFCHG